MLEGMVEGCGPLTRDLAPLKSVGRPAVPRIRQEARGWLARGRWPVSAVDMLAGMLPKAEGMAEEYASGGQKALGVPDWEEEEGMVEGR